ncbi:glycoside hydrolase family 28 protein [Treponema sp.]
MNAVKPDAFGGINDSKQDNTVALRTALEYLGDSGGGTLLIPPGIWTTGPLRLYSDTKLHLEEGSTLSFIPDPELYRPVRTRWEGIECFAMHPLIFANGQHDVAITGNGSIDGNGAAWWAMLRAKRAANQKRPETPIERELARLNPGYESQSGGGGGREFQFLRPPTIQFHDCTDVLLENISVANSPFWTIHPVYCDRLTISNVRVRNPLDAPNTDGIDIDSCSNVLISDCQIAVGDDGIALKSGSGPDGIRVNRPTCNVVVRQCRVADGHGGIVIGSETAAGVHDVLTEDCEFLGTDRGIRIKTRRGRGGEIRDLTFRNLRMKDNLCPLAINMYYRCGSTASDGELFSTFNQPVTNLTPRISNVNISGIRARGCRASAGFIAGLPESPIENLSITDSIFETDESSPATGEESDMYLGLPPVKGKGFRILNVHDPVFTRVSVHGPAEPFIYG